MPSWLNAFGPFRDQCSNQFLDRIIYTTVAPPFGYGLPCTHSLGDESIAILVKHYLQTRIDCSTDIGTHWHWCLL